MPEMQPQAGYPMCDADDLAARFQAVRRKSAALCAPLAVEDYVIQGMPNVSPPRWHLAHTTWFFEHFLLVPHCPGYRIFHPRYGYLFNSYYVTVGKFFPREQRGLLSRPTVAEIYAYREHVDAAMQQLIAGMPSGRSDLVDLGPLVELGLQHEQQHQELLLTDIKYNFALNPLYPAYSTITSTRSAPGHETAEDGTVPPVATWIRGPSGILAVGSTGTGFAYDNETPRHDVLVRPFRLANRLVTNGEFLEFMHDGGYQRPELWLSDGWATVAANAWQAPMYWMPTADGWQYFTLHGLRNVATTEPVCHVSYYEADAFARWRGKRLPTEVEWEVSAEHEPVRGNFRESGRLHPAAGPAAQRGLLQLFGDVWEWTQSPYMPYPGFKPLAGSVGEYNGKFMSNQMVLKGGSCVSPRGHLRAGYRNFFYPGERWQFTGIRLAEDDHDHGSI